MTTRDGYVKERAGRHWKYSAKSQRYLLQCRDRCARYLPVNHFERFADNSYALSCSSCKKIDPAKYGASRVAATRRTRRGPGVQTDDKVTLTLDGVLNRAKAELTGWIEMCNTTSKQLVCRTCGALRPRIKYEHALHKGHFYRDCSSCREDVATSQPKSGLPPLDRAYAQLYPDLVDYGPKVTGYEILSDPKLYPGRTYFHLSKEERAKAVDLAQQMVREAA